MSGPKNHRTRRTPARRQIDLERRVAADAARRRKREERMRINQERAQRRAAELARKRAEQLARMQAEGARRNEARAAAQQDHIRNVAEELLTARAEAVRENLQRRQHEASKRKIAAAQVPAEQAEAPANAQADAGSSSTMDELPAADAEMLEGTIDATVPVPSHEIEQLQEKLSELAAWREELAADEAVQQFHRTAAEAWTALADACLADDSPSDSLAEALESVENACGEAQRLHDEAGKRQADFTARNELLRDVIDSFKEIGFFVGDPQYADPNDPAGPVLVKATRGSEVMTASIDLSQMVRSMWDGLQDEHCKASFFEYVERMKARGIEIEPEREDLRQPPMLKQQGAKELPRGQQIGGGA